MKNLILAILLFGTFNCFAQSVEELQKKYTVVNRTISVGSEPGSVHLNDAENQGLAWINGEKFTYGSIEVDIKGKDVLQKSFVGIAFHGVNDSTMEAVYFRPFNFKNEDAARRSHMVQYISMPDYDWEKLRTGFPGKYENKIDPAPGPDDWFHVKIIVKGKRVSVFVNNEQKAALEVEKLNANSKGGFGLWVGNNSGGSFANLTITNSGN